MIQPTHRWPAYNRQHEGRPPSQAGQATSCCGTDRQGLAALSSNPAPPTNKAACPPALYLPPLHLGCICQACLSLMIFSHGQPASCAHPPCTTSTAAAALPPRPRPLPPCCCLRSAQPPGFFPHGGPIAGLMLAGCSPYSWRPPFTQSNHPPDQGWGAPAPCCFTRASLHTYIPTYVPAPCTRPNPRLPTDRRCCVPSDGRSLPPQLQRVYCVPTHPCWPALLLATLRTRVLPCNETSSCLLSPHAPPSPPAPSAGKLVVQPACAPS